MTHTLPSMATDPGFTDVSEVFRVSGRSNAEKVAAKIAHTMYEGKTVAVRAIGAGAVNQAIKACAIARSMAHKRGLSIAFVPGFDTVMFDFEGQDVERSAITLRATALECSLV